MFGFPYVGFYRYFLTFCTLERDTIFTVAEIVSTALEQIQRTAVEEKFAVLAYCFMPDHVHLLVEGRSGAADMRKFVKVAKQRVVHHLRQHGVKRVWQEGYYDRVLRSDESTRDVLAHILNNPVRKNLVTTASDYPFSGTSFGTLAEVLF